MIRNRRESGTSIAIRNSYSLLGQPSLSSGDQKQKYSIQFAQTIEDRESVYQLAHDAYLEKGYISQKENNWLINPYDSDESTAILIVKDEMNQIVGSLSIVFDGEQDIPAHALYPDEVKALRSRGHKIAEVSRLVVDKKQKAAKDILILLFNSMYLYCYYVKNYSCLTIEVNPRHKNYYRELLLFDEIGDTRDCPIVSSAPAVLLFVPLERGADEVLKCSSNRETKNKRSLYPHFLQGQNEQDAIHFLKENFRPITDDALIYFGITPIADLDLVTF